MRPEITTSEEVMFFDTDCGGVVHNIAYLRWIETARTRLGAQLGLDLKTMAETKLFAVVLRTEIDYRQPARIGDTVSVRGRLERLERARFWVGFEILLPPENRLLVTCRQSLALVQMPKGRPVRLPEGWARKYPEALPQPDGRPSG